MNIQTINGCHNYGQPMGKIGDKLKKVVTKVVDKGKDVYVDTWKKVANAAGGVAFLPQREAIKIVIGNNLLGLATILAYYRRSKADRYEEILKTWDKFGGDKATFSAVVNEGSKKGIRQIAPAVLNRVSKIKNTIKLAYKINSGAISGCKTFPAPKGIGFAGYDDAAIGGLLLSALPIILEMVSVFKKDKATDPDAIPDGGVPEGSPQGGSQTDPSEVGKPEDEKTGDNTMLYVGIAVAAVVGYFAFLKK